MSVATLFEKWIEKEKRVATSKKRQYLHFDPRINFPKNISQLRDYLLNKEKIATHSFYPFIKSDIIVPRYKKTGQVNSNGKPSRKLENKIRPIAYAGHYDAFIYSWYSTMLSEQYEKKTKELGIYDCVLAYLEKNKSNIEFAHEVFMYIKSRKDSVVLAFDITSFFDGLDHSHLHKMWCKVIEEERLPNDHFNVYKSVTTYSTVEKALLEIEFGLAEKKENNIYLTRICTPLEFRERVRNGNLIEANPFKNKVKRSSRYNEKCGIPQGSPISACLSNIYMIDFDIRINAIANELGGLYRRYCDDIILIVNPEDFLRIKDCVLNTIVEYHLDINDSKTDITHFKALEPGTLKSFDSSNLSKEKNMQYLGFEFNGESAYIRSSSLSKYYRRMTARIRENLKAAYGGNSIGTKIFRKKLYNRYTNKGERNFITYAERAFEHMESKSIYKQVKNSTNKVKKKLSKKNDTFIAKRPKIMK